MTAAIDASAPADDRARSGAWRLLLADPVAATSAAVLVAIVLISVIGGAIATGHVNETDALHALQPPSWAHPFGTDGLGRDVLVRVIASGRTSLTVAVVSVAFALVLGGTIGILAGYRRGWVDTVLMRVTDVMFAFPVMLLALAIVSILNPGIVTTILAIGIVYTPIFARVARAATLAVAVEPFVEVSRTMGSPSWYVLTRHVVPAVSGPLIVQTSLSLAFAILSEAALSFLGLGVQPPAPSWGSMLNDAQNYLGLAWWLSVFPGIAIFLTALAFNLLGDGLRDVLDPRHRTRMEARGRA